MTKFRMRLTKTETVISTYEIAIDLPTTDPAKAAIYGEIGANFDRWNHKAPFTPHWHDGEPIVKITCEAFPVEERVLEEVVRQEPPERPPANGDAVV